MTVRAWEGFDGEATLSQLTNGDTSYAGGVVAIPATVGKWFGSSTIGNHELNASGRTGQCYKKISESGASIVSIGFWTGAPTEVFFGVAFSPVTATPAAGYFVCRFYDQAGATCFSLTMNADGSLTATTGGAATATSAAAILSAGVFQYLQVRFKLADVGGVAEVKKTTAAGAESTILTVTGDTKGAGNTSVLGAILGDETGHAGLTSNGSRWDDVYFADAAAGGTYLGVVKVQTTRPSGDGNSSQWVGSDGNSTNNYQLVDEQSTNDADYVASTTDGDKDTYAMGDLALTGTVLGVQVVARGARMNSDDPKDLGLITRLNASEDSSTQTLTTTLREVCVMQEARPGGGSWTADDINAMETGYSQVDA